MDCSIFLRLFILLSIINISIISANCSDKSPYCNKNDCAVRPGYAIVYCKKTCGNCMDFCEDSKYITCSSERMKDCDDMLSDYCPKLCGKCTPRMKNIAKRTKTIAVRHVNIPSTTTTTTTTITPPFIPKFSSIRMKQPRMMPNGTFINPPIPRYEKLDDTTYTIPDYPVATIEELLPQPQRIWPEPEPLRIEPVNVYQSYSYLPVQQSQQQPQHYSQSWSPQSIGLSSSIDNTRRAPQSLSPYPYQQYPDQKYNTVTSDMSDNTMQLVEPFLAPPRMETAKSQHAMASLINLLGCKDKDEMICKHVTAETCLSRPGYYLKLCPVTCKNCSGFQCIDSIKIDCNEVKIQGACKLSVASEYCPRTCEYCNPPKDLVDNMSECKDELETCEQLSESGACEQDFSKSALRLYCAKSCGFCKRPQFYFSDSPLMSSVFSTRKIYKNSLNRRDRFIG